ncbi:hypothetical protein chiPu_0019515 [Chiloscyllium punctatum]|uniref:Uncharacterized protein n=1 Tax=Chiloscyllium punctatum TaxID=137246 RepID=A0A401RSB0_CHIPU|nr:hypothetical protein [Chiloscyllium punctatum]
MGEDNRATESGGRVIYRERELGFGAEGENLGWTWNDREGKSERDREWEELEKLVGGRWRDAETGKEQ